MNCNALIKMKTTADSDTVAGARRQRPPREGRCAAGAGDSLRGRGAAGARRRRCRLGAVQVAEGRGPGTAREGGGGGEAAPGGVWDSVGEPRGRPAAGPRHVPGHPSRRATRTVRVVAARVGMTLRPSQSRRCIGDASEIIGDATWGFPVGQQPTGHQAARGKPRHVPGPGPARRCRPLRTHARTRIPPHLLLLHSCLEIAPCTSPSMSPGLRRRLRVGDADARSTPSPIPPHLPKTRADAHAQPPDPTTARPARARPGPHRRTAPPRPAAPPGPAGCESAPAGPPPGPGDNRVARARPPPPNLSRTGSVLIYRDHRSTGGRRLASCGPVTASCPSPGMNFHKNV